MPKSRTVEVTFLDLLSMMLSHDASNRRGGLSNADLGWCPHGATEDEGCEEPGCYGGPEGCTDGNPDDYWDDVDEMA